MRPHSTDCLLLFNLATDVEDPILGFTTQWIRALAEKVHFIHVLTMRSGRLDVPSNVQVHSVGKEKGYSEPRRVAEFYRILLALIRRKDIGGCFSHMMPLFSAMAGPILRLRQIPLITLYAHPSLTPTLKLAHFLSNQIVTSLPRSYPYRKDKLTVIGQGIDTAFFKPGAHGGAEKPLILCVGRLSRVKNHITLIRAARQLKSEWADPFRVVLLGGPAGDRDSQYVTELQ